MIPVVGPGRSAAAVAALVLLGGAAFPAAGQEANGPADLVTITVGGDRHYTLPHVIRISAETPIFAQSQQQIAGRQWRASRTSERGEQVITSETCAPLRGLALSFRALPAVEFSPRPLVASDSPLPIPPTRKDGFETRLSFTTVTSDGSTAEVVVKGGNAYAAWGHDAVAALLRCWGPLTP